MRILLIRYMKNINLNPLKIKNMAATFLPSILVPIVGLIFPAFSMALFFLYIQNDDIA